MRRKIAGPVRAKAGQRLTLSATLVPDVKRAHIDIYSCTTRKGQPAPFVPAFKMDVKDEDGMPSLVEPNSLKVYPELQEFDEIKIVSDEDCWFYLFQDVDTKKDTLVKGRIKNHDATIAQRIASALRWYR